MRKLLRPTAALIILMSISSMSLSADPPKTGTIKEAPSGKDDLKQKQDELNSIYSELVRNKRKLNETKRQAETVVQRLFIINRDLRKTRVQLGRAEDQIQQNERRLDYLKVSLEDAKKKMIERGDRFRGRIKEIYKSGGLNYIQLLLSSDSLGDLVNKIYFFEKLMARDVVLVNNIVTQHDKIKTDKKQLEGVTSDIRGLAVYIEEKKKNIEHQAEEKKQVYKELEGKRVEYEKKIAELEEASNQVEAMLKKMMAERATKGTVAPRGSGSIIWPVRGRITSTFGYRRSPFWRRGSRHTGIDIANSHGTPIRAADGGEVIFSGWWDGYGKAAIIDHGKGIATLYGHMSRIYVQKGQSIQKGEIVGLMGSTGYSTGPHLHFEVRVNGTPQNPSRWLP